MSDSQTPTGLVPRTLKKRQSFVAYLEDNGEPGQTDRFRLWVHDVEGTLASRG